MEKKGTGWIPDYPDVNDYTLQSDAINNLANRIQSQGATSSIDNLAQKVYEALGILVDKYGDGDGKLEEIRKDLNKEILGDLSFVTAEFHNVFKEGVADSEVLLIKNYLQHILAAPWKANSNLTDIEKDEYSITDVTDVTFDSQTSKQVQALQEAMIINSSLEKAREADGFVDNSDLKVINILADISSTSSYIRVLADITKVWKESLEDTDEQINFAIYLQDIADKLYPITDACFTLGYSVPALEKKQEPEPDKATELRLESIKEIKKFSENLPSFLSNLKNEAEDVYIKNASFLIHMLEKVQSGYETRFQELANVLEDKHTFLNEIALLEDLLKDFQKPGDTELQIKAFDAYNYLTTKILPHYQIFMMQLYKIKIPKILPEMFEEEITPIASPINELSQILRKKFFTKKISKSKYSQLEYERAAIKSIPSPEAKEKAQQEIQNIIQEFISSFIEVIAQMLMPLGQHSNLSEAVDREIKKAQDLVEAKKDNQEESKKLIREIIDFYKFSSVINLDTKDNFDFQRLIFETIEKLKNDSALVRVFQELEEKEIENIDVDDVNDRLSISIHRNFFGETSDFGLTTSIKQEIIQIMNTPLYSIVKGYLKGNLSEQDKGKRSVETKKPIFEIPLSELGMDKADSSSSSDNMRSQQMRNKVVFPINSFLRDELDKLVPKQNEETQKESENKKKQIFLSLPEFVDLTYWCSPVEDQGSLNSCTAYAGIALMEYAEKKISGSYIDGSPRFLYKVTRNLIQREGDSGASVRDTMKAMVAFGVCPEQYWLYDEDKYDEEPTPFCYSFAENYKTLKYFRLDYASISRYTLLAQVKVLLASEFPCIFGFTLYNSVYDEFNVQRGHIPLPHQRDKVIGGHTVVAVGYHDRKVIENADGKRSEGALLIRNSWGTRWGQGGYGWLPYDYIIQGLTADWWSLLKPEWLPTGRFGAGASAWNPDKGGEPGVLTGQQGTGGNPH